MPKKKDYSEYKYISNYCLIDAYILPDNSNEWYDCPYCKLKPKNWCYDNGMSTGCGCGNSKYDHWSIRCESILSVYKRTGKTIEYGSREELRENWNHWCKTGEDNWPNDYEKTGKW